MDGGIEIAITCFDAYLEVALSDYKLSTTVYNPVCGIVLTDLLRTNFGSLAGKHAEIASWADELLDDVARHLCAKGRRVSHPGRRAPKRLKTRDSSWRAHAFDWMISDPPSPPLAPSLLPTHTRTEARARSPTTWDEIPCSQAKLSQVEQLQSTKPHQLHHTTVRLRKPAEERPSVSGTSRAKKPFKPLTVNPSSSPSPLPSPVKHAESVGEFRDDDGTGGWCTGGGRAVPVARDQSLAAEWDAGVVEVGIVDEMEKELDLVRRETASIERDRKRIDDALRVMDNVAGSAEREKATARWREVAVAAVDELVDHADQQAAMLPGGVSEWCALQRRAMRPGGFGWTEEEETRAAPLNVAGHGDDDEYAPDAVEEAALCQAAAETESSKVTREILLRVLGVETRLIETLLQDG
ncbi:hypothetical protein PYCC9005_005047 [Savitreella phatthalungensis]